MPNIIVYTRVSTPDQESALDAQDRAAMGYTEYVKSRFKEPLTVVGPLRDKSSAFRLPFHQRPTGKVICEMLQPGDHIVFARLDRFVRLGKDFELQTAEWKARGVTLHFADMGITLGTAAGDLMARFFAAIAQYYSESLSERVKAALRERFVYQGRHDPRSKILVKKIFRPGLPALSLVNKETMAYLRYVVWRRRHSYRNNGVADSMKRIGDDLEMARVRHGYIPEYRPEPKRKQWRDIRIVHALAQLVKSEVAALQAPTITAFFREGLDPLNLPPGPRYRRPKQTRSSIYEHIASRDLFKPSSRKKLTQWAIQYVACVQCGSSNSRHMGNGICYQCYLKQKKQNEQTRRQSMGID